MYWLTLLILLTFIFIFFNNKEYFLLKKILLSLILSLFIVFGSKSMQDFSGYVEFYKDIDTFDTKYSGLKVFEKLIALIATSSGGFEPGFIYLNRIFYDMGFSALEFLTIFTFFTNLIFLNFLSKYPRFSICIFFLISTQFYFQQGNLVRQMFAISILVTSIKYINSNQLVKFLILVFLASTIHIGSLIFIISYFLPKFNFRRNILLFIWLLSVITFFNPGFFPINPGQFGVFFTKELTRSESVGDLVHFNYIYNAIALLYIISYNKICIKQEYKTIFLIFYFGICLGNLVSITEWFYRISLYFLPVVIVLFSQIDLPLNKYFNFKNNINKIVLYGFLCCFLIAYPFRFSLFPNETAIGKEIYKFSEFFDF